MKLKPRYLILLGILGIVFVSYGAYVDFQNVTYPLSNIDAFRISLTIIGNVFNLMYIFFMIKESLWSYIFGLVGIIATFIYLVIWSPLIWDILINIIYFILSFYGIYFWLHPEKKQKQEGKLAKTRSLTSKEWGVYILLSLVSIIALSIVGQNLGRYTSILQATSDATTTILAILAQWLTTRKVLESWLFWFFVNIISVPLYISIGSYTFAMGFAVYALSSGCGYISWKYQMLKDK